MSYSVNWITKVITIPTSDLTLVSGFRYSLPMDEFLDEIRRLEWQPDEGLWAVDVLDHSNTRFDFVGSNYAPFDEILNGYTVIFTGVATRVDLLGSNNNIVDVLIPSGIAIVSNNSAGLQIVEVGVGTPADVADAVWDALTADHQDPDSTGEALTDPTAVADAVWDAQKTDHQDPDSMGEALGDVSASSNPWKMQVNSSNTRAGTFGELIGIKFVKIFNRILQLIGIGKK